MTDTTTIAENESAAGPEAGGGRGAPSACAGDRTWKTRAIILCVLLWGGFALRLAFDRGTASAVETPLAREFDQFPTGLLGPDWREQILELDAQIEKTAGVSSYLNRQYVRGADRLWFYVGYVGGFRANAIHHPGVCFAGSGRTVVREQSVDVPALVGENSGSFAEYEWSMPSGQRAYTLASFYYNGKFEPSELRLRADRVTGMDYFAVVIVDGPSKGSVERNRTAYFEQVRRLVPAVLEHFAD